MAYPHPSTMPPKQRPLQQSYATQASTHRSSYTFVEAEAMDFEYQAQPAPFHYFSPSQQAPQFTRHKEQATAGSSRPSQAFNQDAAPTATTSQRIVESSIRSRGFHIPRSMPILFEPAHTYTFGDKVNIHSVPLPEAYRGIHDWSGIAVLDDARVYRLPWFPNCSLADLPDTDEEIRRWVLFLIACVTDTSAFKDKPSSANKMFLNGLITWADLFRAMLAVVAGWSGWPVNDPTITNGVVDESQRNLTFTKRMMAIGYIFQVRIKPVIDALKWDNVEIRYILAPETVEKKREDFHFVNQHRDRTSKKKNTAAVDGGN